MTFLASSQASATAIPPSATTSASTASQQRKVCRFISDSCTPPSATRLDGVAKTFRWAGPRLNPKPVSAPGVNKLIGLPLHWSETNNIKWKTEIPFKGWSTPIMMGNQIWLTTATPDGRDYFAICVDKENGKILFNEKVFHTDNPEPLG